jgi:hypothetical protein
LTRFKQELEKQNKLLKQYMDKYFSSTKIKQLAETFSFSELRKLIGEMDIEFFALCYFPKHFDRKFGKFHQELFQELKYMLSNKELINAFGLPGEHGKSTINSFLFPLYATLYDKSQFTLIISATEQIALPFLEKLETTGTTETRMTVVTMVTVMTVVTVVTVTTLSGLIIVLALSAGRNHLARLELTNIQILEFIFEIIHFYNLRLLN